MRPAVIDRLPAIAFNRLDFPDPLVPRTAVNVPRPSSRSTWSSARTSLAVPRLNACETPSTRTALSNTAVGSFGRGAKTAMQQPGKDQNTEDEERRHQLESVRVES